MDQNKLNHVAFILDGNKRWAKNNNLSKKDGYNKGFNKIIEIVDYSLKINLKNLTIFALSSENFHRSSINLIYEIIYNNFTKFLDDLIKKKEVKIKIFGNKYNLPQKVIDIFEKSENYTCSNNSLNLNIAFNYGFKDEIKNVITKYYNNPNGNINDINNLNNLFYLGNISDPDILIRTGGHKRLSNFIMYNLTYTELFFIDTLWPEFTLNDFEKIIDEYMLINRKYGL